MNVSRKEKENNREKRLLMMREADVTIPSLIETHKLGNA
jgi:hypothetical protein